MERCKNLLERFVRREIASIKKVDEGFSRNRSPLCSRTQKLSFTTRAIATCNRKRFHAGSPSRVHGTSVYTRRAGKVRLINVMRRQQSATLPMQPPPRCCSELKWRGRKGGREIYRVYRVAFHPRFAPTLSSSQYPYITFHQVFPLQPRL